MNNMYNYMNYQPQEINSYKGLVQGNLFENLYEPYKNYQPPQLIPHNKREELLLKVRQYDFAMNDLNLYLDTEPTDKEAIELFNNYRNLAFQAITNFEASYGPLTVSDNPINTNKWIWNANPWPWEVQ
ncbi:MAG: spore coat protein CotJB [bacterium]|nr:spore coat protein CotJB [bacterium]